MRLSSEQRWQWSLVVFITLCVYASVSWLRSIFYVLLAMDTAYKRTIEQRASNNHPKCERASPTTNQATVQKSTAKWSENLYRVTNSRSLPLLSSMLRFFVCFFSRCSPLSIPSRQSYRLKFIHSNGTAFWFPPSTLPNDDDSDYFDCCCCYHTKYVTFCVILLFGECVLDHDNCFLRIFMNRMRYTFLINTYFRVMWAKFHRTTFNRQKLRFIYGAASFFCMQSMVLAQFSHHLCRPFVHITSIKFSSNLCDVQHPTCLLFHISASVGVCMCVYCLCPKIVYLSVTVYTRVYVRVCVCVGVCLIILM